MEKTVLDMSLDIVVVAMAKCFYVCVGVLWFCWFVPVVQSNKILDGEKMVHGQLESTCLRCTKYSVSDRLTDAKAKIQN